MTPNVLITGVSSGIGRATARQFLAEDGVVYATARSVKDIADLAEAGCHTARLDVTEPTTISDIVDMILERDGSLNCLVNNAGYGQFGAVEDVGVDEMQAQFDVNVFGPYRLIRVVLRKMRERRRGTIINVSSVAGWFLLPAKAAYNASKFALRGLTETLQAEVEQFGIDVILIEPEFVDTGFHATADSYLAGIGQTPTTPTSTSRSSNMNTKTLPVGLPPTLSRIASSPQQRANPPKNGIWSARRLG